ncbi:MAG: heavy-metal-associated domain-containing protein [Fimbriimonadales bacterium]|nr:heavy-metal-associated domain-containing protein [Fimbriimonadales bacterium]
MTLLEKVWSVPTIECEGCVRAIHRTLGDVKGVQHVEVDRIQKVVRVVFDANQVQEDTLRDCLAQAGFSPLD